MAISLLRGAQNTSVICKIQFHECLIYVALHFTGSNSWHTYAYLLKT